MSTGSENSGPEAEFPAGPILNAEVSERVFGYRTHVQPDGSTFEHRSTGYHQLPPYSTDIAAAWLVIERMQAQRWRMARLTSNTPPHADPATAWECDVRYYPPGKMAPFTFRSAAGATAPEAICRAALLALAALEREP